MRTAASVLISRVLHITAVALRQSVAEIPTKIIFSIECGSFDLNYHELVAGTACTHTRTHKEQVILVKSLVPCHLAKV